MVEVKVYSGGSVGSQNVDESAFGERVLGRTLKDAVVMYEANARQGTAKSKNRTAVAGPNNKRWKQKHTGNARMGTKKSGLWRGGGTIFGPLPRDHSYQMPRKARRVALRNAVFTKFRDGEVAIADGFPTDAPSTKAAFAVLEALGVQQSALVVTADRDSVVYRSLRNVPLVDVLPVNELNAHNVLLRRNMVLTPAAFEALQERVKTSAKTEKAAS